MWHAPAIKRKRKQRKKMEKKIYLKPESEVIALGLGEEVMQFDVTSMEFKPEPYVPGEETQDP